MRAVSEGFEDAQAQAYVACSEIDAQMTFIGKLFGLKYNRKCNPFKDPENRWENEVGFREDDNMATFVRSVTLLVQENGKLLS